VAKKKAKAFSPAEQKKKMIEKYGTQCHWVDVPVYLTYQEMLDFFGEPCKEHEPLCAVCSAWLMWNKTGKAEISIERDEIIKIMSK
jgi:predicted Rdx family selenoprotein